MSTQGTRDTIVIESTLGPYTGQEEQKTPGMELVSYVMGYVTPNRKHRDNAFKPRWDSYYRVWRGQWTSEDRNRKSERSRIVSPGTQQAVDSTLAELVEAIFGSDTWFDLPDDINDQEREDAIKIRDQLREDLYEDGIVPRMIEILQNGALYGQLLAKIVVDTKQVAEPIQVKQEDGSTITRKMYSDRVAIYPVPIEPGQLVWDMSGPTRADDMLGLAHEFPLALHKIKQRQESGVYNRTPMIGSNMMIEDATDERALEGENPKDGNQQRALITEYHGLVPKKLLAKVRTKDDPIAAQMADSLPDSEMVEAIITIANESELLRAIPNPCVMDDRAIIAEQFDTVPNRFIGRGIPEKAYSSQKGLDLELRARADALAWTNNPMLAVDVNRLPPKMDLNVWPGKVFATRGNPKEVVQEFRFGDVNASTFQQTQEYMQMLQQATGARDPADVNAGTRDQATGAAGIAVSGMIKRNKRIMFHVEAFLSTLLRRIVWRKMQFEPQRYPTDYKFQVKGTMGMMARELEVAQLVQLMQYSKELPGVQGAIVNAIIDHSASPRKAELKAAVEKALQPDPEQQKQQQLMQQLQMETIRSELEKTQAETAKLLKEAGVKGAEEQLKLAQARSEAAQIRLTEIERLVDVAQVRVQEAQVMQQNRQLDQMDRQLDQKDRELSQRSSKE